MDQGRYGEEKDREESAYQGSYGAQAESWVCPACETINTEEVCFVCGYSQMKRTANLNALKRVGIGIVAAIFVCGVVLFAGASNRRKYNNACNLLSQQQFEEAISLFAELGDYKDSETMRTEATFIWVENLLAKKMYNDALDTLAQMPDNEKKADCIQEVRYQKASFICQQTYANFKLAYLEFEQIPGYKDSDEQKAQLVVDWAKRIIQSDDLEDAQVFLETISDLSDNQSKKIYEFIITDDYYRSDLGHDVPGLTGTDLTHAFASNSCILDVLTGDIPYKEELKLLFSSGGDMLSLNDYIIKNEDFLRRMWEDVPMIREVIVDSGNIDTWLWGRWENDSGMYIQFDGYNTNYNLPADPKPDDATGFSITLASECRWYKYNGYDNVLLQVPFRIALTDADAIEVYCYKNDETYTLHRSK